eukprot:CAMPEP_0206487254 /NCGR_PEP_ID=MMETSP0324_2-20121206/41513_1 /ASSEMBLY_ACC=CAM_ASM_000836 /TAXON_ID=2866 /ORGANISM="Crypthecodinium cohnii, Strain Seligo" /LENGTH=74 /DNA_ID=CAMNT_0053965663 /DNA_START=677 /DNA_END=901 /DNA_ORIENTATION=+
MVRVANLSAGHVEAKVSGNPSLPEQAVDPTAIGPGQSSGSSGLLTTRFHLSFGDQDLFQSDGDSSDPQPPMHPD